MNFSIGLCQEQGDNANGECGFRFRFPDRVQIVVIVAQYSCSATCASAPPGAVRKRCGLHESAFTRGASSGSRRRAPAPWLSGIGLVGVISRDGLTGPLRTGIPAAAPPPGAPFHEIVLSAERVSRIPRIANGPAGCMDGPGVSRHHRPSQDGRNNQRRANKSEFHHRLPSLCRRHASCLRNAQHIQRSREQRVWIPIPICLSTGSNSRDGAANASRNGRYFASLRCGLQSRLKCAIERADEAGRAGHVWNSGARVSAGHAARA